MNDSHIETLEQVRQFLDGAAVMKITILSKTECYRWIRGVLVRFRYRTLGKADKGLIRRYLQQISGYSRAQIARLIKQYQKDGTDSAPTAHRERLYLQIHRGRYPPAGTTR